MPESWVFHNSTLERVIDGDTFIANVYKEVTAGRSQQKFRLNRIACAPLLTPSGTAAAAELTRLLLLMSFTLTSVAPYKYGDEWMAEVDTVYPYANVNDWLVYQQYAVYWNGRGTQPVPPWPRTR
jgi:endonuclease YncB( thermonuclease family)